MHRQTVFLVLTNLREGERHVMLEQVDGGSRPEITKLPWTEIRVTLKVLIVFTKRIMLIGREVHS